MTRVIKLLFIKIHSVEHAFLKIHTIHYIFTQFFIENSKVFTIILQISLEVLTATDFEGSRDI